jgi:uncharacterized membrane protein
MPSIGPTELVIIFVILAMFVVIPYLLIKGIVRASRPDTAMDALRTRLATGEIDQAEYERLRSILQRG